MEVLENLICFQYEVFAQNLHIQQQYIIKQLHVLILQTITCIDSYSVYMYVYTMHI